MVSSVEEVVLLRNDPIEISKENLESMRCCCHLDAKTHVWVGIILVMLGNWLVYINNEIHSTCQTDLGSKSYRNVPMAHRSFDNIVMRNAWCNLY